MDEAFRQQAEEWFLRGDHDIETADLLYNESGHMDSVAYHIQQAIEKYLKGYLALNGKRPPRIHELDTILNHVIAFDDSLAGFLDICEKVSLYYIEARYPPGPPMEYDRQEIKRDLDSAWELARKIRAKANR